MGLLTGLIIAGTALTAGSQIAAAGGARRAANDAIAEGDRLAADALRRGELDAERYRMDLSRLLGAQRAGFGAAGVDPTFGSAAAIAAETERFGETDITTIRENAMREAYGLRTAGRNQATQLRSQATSQYLGAFGTALSGGSRAWGNYTAARGIQVPSYNNYAAHQTARAWRPASLTP